MFTQAPLSHLALFVCFAPCQYINKILQGLDDNNCEFKMRETYCFVNSFSACSPRLLRSLSKGLSTLSEFNDNIFYTSDCLMIKFFKVLMTIFGGIENHTYCDFKMWETYCFVNSFWNRLVLCLSSAMFYFLSSKPFSLSYISYSLSYVMPFFYGVSFDPALVNWNVQEPFILQTYYARTPNISTMIRWIPSFLSYFIIPIIFSNIFSVTLSNQQLNNKLFLSAQL